MEEDVRTYLEYLEKERNYSSHTITSYESDLMSLVQFLRSEMIESLKNVNKESLRAFIGSLLDKGFSQKSIARKIASIRSFFKYLRRHKIVEKNPALVLITPRAEKRLPVFLDEQSMCTLLSSSRFTGSNSKRDMAIIELFYSTGIRLSELINLTMSDVRQNEGLLKVKGKGRKERLVPIGKKAVSALNEYLSSRRVGSTAEHETSKENSLFVTENNKKLYPQAVGRIVRKYISSVSEMKKKSPHVLRHTFATHMLNHGADIRAVKELLGHESLSTTQVYTHVSSAHIKKVYEHSHPKA
jgi:integrase/recombinase XerC